VYGSLIRVERKTGMVNPWDIRLVYGHKFRSPFRFVDGLFGMVERDPNASLFTGLFHDRKLELLVSTAGWQIGVVPQLSATRQHRDG
jgi:hypothetical protein